MESWQGNLDPQKKRRPASHLEKGVDLQLGNPALDTKKMLSRLRKTDPKTGKPYDPGLSREDKLEKINKGMDYIEETAFNQYQTIAGIAREIHGFTEENPETTGKEVIEKFHPDERYLKLSEKQAYLTQTGIQEIADQIDTVDRYFQEYSDRPKELLAKAFAVSVDGLGGEVILTKSNGILNFVVKDQKTFARLKGGREDHIASVGAFLSLHSKIPELRGALCISRDVSEEDLKDTLTHEKRHAINRFLTPDRNKEDPLATAKDEIIAYLEEGRSPEAIKRLLTEKTGYDFMIGTPKESNEWQHFSAEVKFLVDIAAQIKRPDGKIDIELLGVAPIRQWRLLFEKINTDQPLPAREAARLYYEKITGKEKITEALKDLAAGDILVINEINSKHSLMIVVDQVEENNISGYFEALNDKYETTRSYLEKDQGEEDPFVNEIRKCRDERLSQKIAFKKMLEQVSPGDILVGGTTTAFVLKVEGDELTIKYLNGKSGTFSKEILVLLFDSPEGPPFNRVDSAKKYEVKTNRQDFPKELDGLDIGDLLIMENDVIFEVQDLDRQEVVLKAWQTGREIRGSLETIKHNSGSIAEIRKKPRSGKK